MAKAYTVELSIELLFPFENSSGYRASLLYFFGLDKINMYPSTLPEVSETEKTENFQSESKTDTLPEKPELDLKEKEDEVKAEDRDEVNAENKEISE